MNRTWPDDLIEEKEWQVYHEVMVRARQAGIPFAAGGGFAVAAYTGRWRDTKDLDLYTLPAAREALIEVTRDVGLIDLYPRYPYDRRWIYRAGCGNTIVDVISAMANLRAYVDEQWLREGAEMRIRGERLPIVLLDWEYLLQRLGDDTPLLSAALSLYRWVCPGRSRRIPAWVWERLHTPPPPRDAIPEVDWHHATLLDLRPWFAVVESP
jgi:hypothetical protein